MQPLVLSGKYPVSALKEYKLLGERFRKRPRLILDNVCAFVNLGLVILTKQNSKAI
jgi:hypothetical protein